MNLFGKILVALNLVMSLVFMGFAISVYSTHKNWRDEVIDPAKGLKKQLNDQYIKNDELNASVQALKNDAAQEVKLRDNRLRLLETERETLDADVKKATAAVEAVTKDKTATTSAIEALTGEVAKKTQDNDTLSTMIADEKARSDEYYKRIIELTNQLAQLGADVAKLRNAQNAIISENAKFRTILTAHQIDVNAPIANTPPKVDGYVKATTTDGLVEISLGSDDGLTRGHTLEVFRPGPTAGATKYLGRIEILQTKADVSVGKVIPQFRRGNIEKDDRVATRFN